MKIKSIELEGFRGFRNPVVLVIPETFAVICGRNGVGKSTICDAVEFALTGTIERFNSDSTARDSLSEYLWWRGSDAAAESYVRLRLVDDQGEIVVERSRDGLFSGTLKESAMQERLSRGAFAPADALKETARTSILRDEAIAALTLDLWEKDRFTFLSSVVGSIDPGGYHDRCRLVAGVVQRIADDAQKKYEFQRQRLTVALAESARTEIAVSRSGDVAVALQHATPLLTSAPANAQELLPVMRAEAQKRSVELAQLRKLAEDALLCDFERARMNRDENRSERERLLKRLAYLDKTEEKLLAGVETVARASGGGDSEPERPERPLADMQQAIADGRSIAQQRLAAMEDETRELERREGELAAAIERHGIAVGTEGRANAIEAELNRRFEDANQLQRAIAVIETSHTVDRLSEIRREIESAQEQADEAGQRVSRCAVVLRALRDVDSAIERTTNEVVAERLASIEPLLGDLYARLRPHLSWRSINFQLVGTVQRFLRVSVSDGLNPEFLFSSGQRRAAGLAFLLSVYLSRPWSTWSALLLDDPVQHIDDYRALNVIEVLGALSRAGHQIIVAVEDAALADALCRRLRGTAESPGVRFEIGLDPASVSPVISSRVVPPLIVRALSRAMASA